MYLDNTKDYNSDLIDIAWIELSYDSKFDNYTKPIIELHNMDKDI
jgi:8-oxo-dGTP diphosphatase